MYLVMELCDAGGVQKLLEKKTRFTEKVYSIFFHTFVLSSEFKVILLK